jgi:hypothetical protein
VELQTEANLNDNFRYGYGAWRRSEWNASGSWNGLEYGESNYYKLKPHIYDPVERDDEIPLKGNFFGTFSILNTLIAMCIVYHTHCPTCVSFSCIVCIEKDANPREGVEIIFVSIF